MEGIQKVRLIATEPEWLQMLYLVGIVAGMIFNRMTIIVGFGILLFIEVSFGVVKTKKHP